MAKCLVTGHKGYIGAKLYDTLKSQGHSVLGIDLLDSEDPINLVEELAEDSRGNIESKFFDFGPEYVFHLACWPRVGLGIEKPLDTMKNNVIAGSTILNFSRKVGTVKRLIYSSSSSIFGNGHGPTTPYAIQKYTTELECGVYSSIFGLDTVSLRYFNVYSEDQPAEGPYATAISNWMKAIRKNNVPFITGDGEQRRDMVHLDDVISANLFCMNREEAFNGLVCDVGTGKNISLNEVKEIVQKSHNVSFEYKPPRLGEVMYTKADTSTLSDLGWKASISLVDGITKCFDFEA